MYRSARVKFCRLRNATFDLMIRLRRSKLPRVVRRRFASFNLDSGTAGSFFAVVPAAAGLLTGLTVGAILKQQKLSVRLIEISR